MTYIAPTGYPEDWGLEYEPRHPMIATVQPSTGGSPPTLLAINGESQTAVPLTKLMVARLLLQLAHEAAKEIEHE